MKAATLPSKTKFLCNCPAGSSDCPVCQGLPGALPLPGADALRAALDAARALGLTVNPRAFLLRKPCGHPRGYVAATTPLAEGGGARLWLQEGPCGEALLCLESTCGEGLGLPFADLPDGDGPWLPFPGMPPIAL